MNRTKLAIDFVAISSNNAIVASDYVVFARDMKIGLGKCFTLCVNDVCSVAHLIMLGGCLLVVKENCVGVRRDERYAEKNGDETAAATVSLGTTGDSRAEVQTCFVFGLEVTR